MKKATEREKAILFALAAGYIKDWRDAFILSRQGPEENAAELKSIKSSVTHWKQHPEIVQAFETAEALILARDTKIAEEAQKQQEEGGEKEKSAGNNERTKQERPSRVDFYDPQNQRRQINKIIQQAEDDPKTQLDAIKAIQQTQRDDRQAAKEGKSVRVYLPISCDSCPYMEKKRAKRSK